MKREHQQQSMAMKTTLIAPCGMNCRLCAAYTRSRNPCPGCRVDYRPKPKTRSGCRIKNCADLKPGRVRFCYACGGFPCDRLKHLDNRYRTKYGMSMIENLENLKESGVREFVRKEKRRWACPACGEILCVHQALCGNCGRKWR